MLAYKKDLGRDEKKRKDEEQGAAGQPEKSANDLLLGGLAGVAQALKVDIPQPVGKGATQKQVVQGYKTVREALKPQEQQMLDNSARGIAFHTLRKSAGAGAIPTPAQTNAAAKLWLNEALEKEEREEFLRAPWMIGAVNGMLGGFEKQETYFQKSFLTKKQKQLTGSLNKAQERAQDQELDAMQRRQAALEAEDIQKQLTAAENQLYELNGKKRYGGLSASEAVKGLEGFGKKKADEKNQNDSPMQIANPRIREANGLSAEEWNAYLAQEEETYQQILNKQQKSQKAFTKEELQWLEDYEEIQKIREEHPGKMIMLDALAEDDPLRWLDYNETDRESAFKKIMLGQADDLTETEYQAMQAMVKEYGYLFQNILSLPTDPQAWEAWQSLNYESRLTMEEIAVLKDIHNELLPVEERYKAFFQLITNREKAKEMGVDIQDYYQQPERQGEFDWIQEEIEKEGQERETTRKIDGNLSLLELLGAMDALKSGGNLTKEQEERISKWTETSWTNEDAEDEAVVQRVTELEDALGVYLRENPEIAIKFKTHESILMEAIKELVYIDGMMAKSCGLTYGELLAFYPTMDDNDTALIQQAIRNVETDWGKGQTVFEWLHDLVYDPKGNLLGQGGYAIKLGLDISATEIEKALAGFTADFIYPPMDDETMYRTLYEAYIIPYGDIEGRQRLRADVMEAIEGLWPKHIREYLQAELDNCDDILDIYFPAKHLKAYAAAYNKQKQIENLNQLADEELAGLEKGIMKLTGFVGSLVPGMYIDEAASALSWVQRWLLKSAIAAIEITGEDVMDTVEADRGVLTSTQMIDLIKAMAYGACEVAMDDLLAIAGDKQKDLVTSGKLKAISSRTQKYLDVLYQDANAVKGFNAKMHATAAEGTRWLLGNIQEDTTKEEIRSLVGRGIDKVFGVDKWKGNGQSAMNEELSLAVLTGILNPKSHFLEDQIMLYCDGQWPFANITPEEVAQELMGLVLENVEE